jgi:predicted nucleotidyltransferase component of viral defense system
MSHDSEIVEEIAAELGVNPAFVEKDWYSVQVLTAISEQQSDTITTIFSGGTSLSKGYGLIQRFSEDLDFRCRYNSKNSGNQNKKIRRAHRTSILASIETIDSIELDENTVEKASNYIKFPLGYPQYYTGHSALRPTLEVEFSFTQPRLDPESRTIQSLISTFTKADPETSILCLSPVETAADKLSALTWRVIKRQRGDQNDDPAMIRHLHDLCALVSVVEANQEVFIETAISSFEEDQKTGKRETDKEFYQSMLCALHQLKTDTEYHGEYSQFVDAMSYADDENNIDFSSALDGYEELIALFK